MTAETPRTEPLPLRKAMERAFHLGQTYWQQADHEFISQQRKADTTQQTFRDMADATCAQYERDLAAAREQIAAHKTALQFAERAIEDAIYTEDGLEGEAGERVLHVVREAAERGTFDQTKLGELGPSMSEQIAELTAERDSARERVAKLEAVLRQWRIDFGDSMCFEEDPEARRFRDDTDALLAPSPEPKP